MYNYNNFEYIKTITNFNEVICNGWTHFHYICNRNYSNLEVIKYCLENGADFNFKDLNKGWTSFHCICCNYTTKEVLEYCLNNGADLNIKNKYEKTPFNYICIYNKHLIKYCKPYMNEYDFIKTLKECNINWKDYV